jgi:hypothetical protein
MKRLTYNILLMLFILMTIISCAGIQYQDQPVSARTLDSERAKIRTTVLGEAEEWRNSGVIIEKGKRYSINAKGRWLIGAQCNWTGPDGTGAYNIVCWEASPIVKGWTSSALIGKIGEKGIPFGIGAEIDLFPKETGTLYLRINDTPGLCGDNQGHVDVDIALVGTDLQQLGEIKTKASAIQTEQEYIPIKDDAYNRAQGQKWAVVIGVSNYNDSQIPSLRYAANDAQAFHDWLVSKKGGGYAPSRVKLLVNTDATGRNIKNILFNWLGQALEEDTVIVFFAGHGSPQSPDYPNNLFLLPYDANYDDVATTGFPMWDIETALKRFIKAKKVVVIADACHSGGVGQSFDIARRGSRGIEINPISSGLQNLSRIGDGVAVISASDDKQFSQESKDWGGGHGVFTYFLLKGLKGEADYNKDGKVTLGELIPYLSEQVRRETRSAQSPTVAGKFDPALSIGK